jgi:hypothetical protein
VRRRCPVGCAGGQGDAGIQAAQVLLGEHLLSRGRRRAPAGGDVRVLRDVERVEAPGLDLLRQLDWVHAEIGRVDHDSDLHRLSPLNIVSPRIARHRIPEPGGGRRSTPAQRVSRDHDRRRPARRYRITAPMRGDECEADLRDQPLLSSRSIWSTRQLSNASSSSAALLGRRSRSFSRHDRTIRSRSGETGLRREVEGRPGEGADPRQGQLALLVAHEAEVEHLDEVEQPPLWHSMRFAGLRSRWMSPARAVLLHALPDRDPVQVLHRVVEGALGRVTVVEDHDRVRNADLALQGRLHDVVPGS